MRLPIRSAGVVLHKGKVLLIHRRNTKEYYVFPGGGVESSESVEETVIREVQEETSIVVKLNRFLYRAHIIGDKAHYDQYYFLCDYVSGEPKLGQGNELDDMNKGEDFYEPRWIDIKQLSQLPVVPFEVRDWLIEDVGRDSLATIVREQNFNHSEMKSV